MLYPNKPSYTTTNSPFLGDGFGNRRRPHILVFPTTPIRNSPVLTETKDNQQVCTTPLTCKYRDGHHYWSKDSRRSGRKSHCIRRLWTFWSSSGYAEILSNRHIVFENVQVSLILGCFFQKYAKEVAETLGIGGWIKNTKKGTIMGKLQGPKTAMEQMYYINNLIP